MAGEVRVVVGAFDTIVAAAGNQPSVDGYWTIYRSTAGPLPCWQRRGRVDVWR